MTYYELLELYKSGQLNEEDQKKVASDIEKQDAINMYLIEKDDLPELRDFAMDTGGKGIEGVQDDERQESEVFAKQVNSYIRKMFAKTGLIVGAVVLAVVLLVIFAVPKVVDLFYYNPGEIVGTSENGIDTNKISLDLSVYSELFLPGGYRDHVIVESEGYGDYSIFIPQNYSYTSIFTNTAGKVTRNRLTLYNPNILNRPTGNSFVSEYANVDSHYIGSGAAGEIDSALADLQKLNEGTVYMAYVSMDCVMNYDEFVEWCEKNAIEPSWCTICVNTESGYETIEDNLGFLFSSSCRDMTFDREKYPYLTLFDVSKTTDEAHNWRVSSDVMTQHVVSLLKYINDNQTILSLAGQDGRSDYYSLMADKVKEQGIQIYGFTAIGKKADMIKLSETEHAAYIYTVPMQ